jgi:murein DD-endopeptidase MepM/ murein hydrolase activator NlpD
MREARSRAVAVLATGLVASLLATPLGASATVDDMLDDLNGTRQGIDDAQAELEETRDELVSVAEQVRSADQTLAALNAELSSLEQQLRDAKAAAAGAAERTATARADLALLDRELAAAEAYLAEREQILSDRAVSAFMYGSVTYADVVVKSQSVTDFVNTTYYLRTVLLSDRAVVDDIADLKGELIEARTEADRLRQIVEEEQQVADDAAADLQSLTEAQSRVTALAESERQRRASLLNQLELHEAATESELAELEAQSAELEAKLRNARWRAGAPGAGSWVWPTSGRITSSYGYRTHPIYGGSRLHAGVDISGGWGQPIVAANAGLVISAYCQGGGYGCRIVIDHGGGLASLYAHQSSFAVAEGEVVTPGQTIGYVGSTGASTGPHLHFEIRRSGAPEDPMQHY